MENNYIFKIWYEGNFICNITARTKFEAIDKVYYKTLDQNNDIIRNKFFSKKLK